jgi:polyisoprenoid-binding protein YceI
MKLLNATSIIAIGLLGFLQTGSARAIEYSVVQPEKSAVSFVFKQMNVPIQGTFKRFKSKISFDPAKPALAKTDIEIEIASFDAGSEEANDAAADKLWFNPKVFPVAHFVSSAVKPLGNNRFEVTGKMSIKGKTLEVKTPATFHQEGNTGIFEGTFVINRSEYGIGEGMWADYATVANEIQIKFRLVATAAVKK